MRDGKADRGREKTTSGKLKKYGKSGVNDKRKHPVYRARGDKRDKNEGGKERASSGGKQKMEALGDKIKGTRTNGERSLISAREAIIFKGDEKNRIRLQSDFVTRSAGVRGRIRLQKKTLMREDNSNRKDCSIKDETHS